MRRTILKAVSPTVNEAYQEFMRQAKAKGLSEATLLDYRTKMKPFLERYSNTQTDEITVNTLNDYIIYLQDGKRKDTSVQSYCRVVKAFIRFLFEEDYTEEFKIRLPKAEEAIKEVYSDSDLEKLLEKPNLRQASFVDIRNWALITFLVGTGCRITSALNVRKADLDFKEKYITFRKTKGKRALIVPMSDTLADTLRTYLRYRKANDDEYLFVNIFGEQLPVNGAQTAIRRYNEQKGVRLASLHAFRHTFSRNWIRSGGDILRLQRILGHRNLMMTQHYAQLYSEDLQNGFAEHCFLDQKKNGRTKRSDFKRH